MARFLIVFVGILSGVMLAGCSSGEKPVETVPVFGEVKRVNGDPVGDVTVVFYPKTGPVFTTKTDAQGKFSTKTPPGENRVAVVSGSSASTDMSAEAIQKAAEGDSKIDARFASPDSSGLTADVKAKQTEKLVFVVE